MPSRPRIAITVGDPAGIGPEIARKAADDPRVRAACEPVLYGPPAGALFEPGVLSAAAGRAAYDAIRDAVRDAVAGDVAAIATAPINKLAFARAGLPWAGHTELLAHLTGRAQVAMMFWSEPLVVVLATVHLPLADVPRTLTAERLAGLIELVARELPRYLVAARPGAVAGRATSDEGAATAAAAGAATASAEGAATAGAEGAATAHAAGAGMPAASRTARPVGRGTTVRLAMAGLNPHAGEEGLLGDEERRIISPVLVEMRQRGIDIAGPVPGDTVFVRAPRGEFDAVIACYHDQGLIPVKLLAFGRAVNVTLGLPIVRTSVDHGTAFDIAGRGVADPSSMIEAVLLAARMAAAHAGPADAP